MDDSYLAGLFDGEECVSISLARKGYVTLSAKVAMCDSAPVRALYARFGGCYDDGQRRTPHAARNKHRVCSLFAEYV